MARMIRTIISLPEEEKRSVEGFAKERKMSVAEVIRRALRGIIEAEGTGETVRGPRKNLMEEGRPYGSTALERIIDADELKRRAIAAAGLFASGRPDLSIGHDLYLAGDEPEGDHGSEGRGPTPPKPREKRERGAG